MKRKFMGIVLAMCMLVACAPCVTYAENLVKEGNLIFDKDTGTITYCGVEESGYFLIPNQIDGITVRTIGDYAFSRCDELTGIKIPDSITYIGEYAFYDCTMLTNVEMSNNINHIGEYAFLGCENLVSISIPENTKEIGAGTFAYCNNLTDITVSLANPNYKSIDGILFTKDEKTILQYPAGKSTSYTIPSSVTVIGEDSFYGCTNIESITIPDTVTYISDGAFAKCYDLSEISIPYGVTYIGSSAFTQCGFTSIVIPGSVETIGMFAFDNSDIENIIIENGIRSIEDEVFNGCSLEEIFIPSSVDNIGVNTFGWCNHLVAINVAKTNQNYKSIDGVLFTKDGKTLMQYPAGKSISYIVPENVTKIEERAFYGCKYLKNITIPTSVTRIDSDSFYYCNSLTDVYYKGTESQWSKIEKKSSLNNATIHYESSAPTVVHSPTIGDVEITKDGDMYEFRIELGNVTNSCRLLIAAYNNNQVIAVHSIPVYVFSEYSDITFTAERPDTAKIFLWDSLSSLCPLCETQTITIE